jgi:hypothetical protein
LNKKIDELRKVASNVLSAGVAFQKAKEIRLLIKEAKVMAILALIKKG